MVEDAGTLNVTGPDARTTQLWPNQSTTRLIDMDPRSVRRALRAELPLPPAALNDSSTSTAL